MINIKRTITASSKTSFKQSSSCQRDKDSLSSSHRFKNEIEEKPINNLSLIEFHNYNRNIKRNTSRSRSPLDSIPQEDISNMSNSTRNISFTPRKNQIPYQQNLRDKSDSFTQLQINNKNRQLSPLSTINKTLSYPTQFDRFQNCQLSSFNDSSRQSFQEVEFKQDNTPKSGKISSFNKNSFEENELHNKGLNNNLNYSNINSSNGSIHNSSNSNIYQNKQQFNQLTPFNSPFQQNQNDQFKFKGNDTFKVNSPQINKQSLQKDYLYNMKNSNHTVPQYHQNITTQFGDEALSVSKTSDFTRVNSCRQQIECKDCIQFEDLNSKNNSQFSKNIDSYQIQKNKIFGNNSSGSNNSASKTTVSLLSSRCQNCAELENELEQLYQFVNSCQKCQKIICSNMLILPYYQQIKKNSLGRSQQSISSALNVDTKTVELDKLKKQLSQLESEKDKLSETLERRNQNISQIQEINERFLEKYSCQEAQIKEQSKEITDLNQKLYYFEEMKQLVTKQINSQKYEETIELLSESNYIKQFIRSVILNENLNSSKKNFSLSNDKPQAPALNNNFFVPSALKALSLANKFQSYSETNLNNNQNRYLA